MSVAKSRHEAERWLAQARADLEAAGSSRAAGRFEWACFQSQQSGEKALEALWYLESADPWGHSLVRLVEEFAVSTASKVAIDHLLPQARRLDKLYIPTRYPNGLPDLTPSEVYDDSEAEHAATDAETILAFVNAVLNKG